jgi:flavin-dependent dehydrogenase
MAKTVQIAGAGLAGLTAGILLARQGYEVTIFEASKNVGGSHSYADSSYIDPNHIRKSLGLEIDDALEPWPLTRIWAYGKKFEFPHPKGVSAFTIERGKGKTSLENVLYRQALDAGVKVEFGAKLNKKELEGLPPGSIIATGLSKSVFESLDIPHKPFLGSLATGKGDSSRPGVIVYFDSFCREFGYYFQARAAAGALVFNIHKPLAASAIQEFKQKLEQNDGIVFKNWDDNLGNTLAWPMARWNNYNLFWQDKILAGTLAGAVSPVLLFGVNGSLFSGKVAALAVTNPKEAALAFKKIAPWHYHYPQFAFRRLRERAPHALLKPLVRAVCRTYHPEKFPHLMRFTMQPPGAGL